MDKLELNIGIFGCVSVGKSTFLNAIAGQQYSDAEIKKTTLVPQVYTEADGEPTNAVIVRSKNREANEKVLRELELNEFNVGKCQPIYHQIDKICDLFDQSIIDPNIKINIFDVPGLNDSSSKDVYFEWVKQNIKKFDVIIFMTDITRGLNSSDETEVLHLLMESMAKTKARMICLMNKCDDIYFDKDASDLIFEETGQESIYLQANNILADIAKSHGFCQGSDRFTAFLPISSENCFIYRALIKNPTCELDQNYQNRLCKNECGANKWKNLNNYEKQEMLKNIVFELQNTYESKILDTGYLEVKDIIQKTIIHNKIEFLMNHLDNDVKDLAVQTVEDVSVYISLIDKYKNRLSIIGELENKSKDRAGVKKLSYETFWKNITSTINNYVQHVSYTKIKPRDLQEYKEFDTLHSGLQHHCLNFKLLVESLGVIPEYPAFFMGEKQNAVIGKLLHIYNQLITMDVGDHVPTRPNSLMSYLSIINIYAKDKFDYYAEKFLDFSCSNKYKHLFLYEKELQELILYINSNITKEYRNVFSKQIATILLNKVNLMADKNYQYYFYYLVNLKKIIGRATKKAIRVEYSQQTITFLLSFKEIVSKNISTTLGTQSVSNIYKQEIDNVKASNILSSIFVQPQELSSLRFERSLVSIFK